MLSKMRIAMALAGLVVLAAASPAGADGGHSFLGDDGIMLTARWEPAVPLGDLRTHVDNVSPVGVSGDIRVALGNSNLSLGVAGAWNHFYGGTPRTDVKATSALAAFHVYLTRSAVQPYLGVGAGAVYAKTATGNGPEVNDWGACANPQLGLLVTVTRELALDIQAQYKFVKIQAAGAQNFQWVGLGLGFGMY